MMAAEAERLAGTTFIGVSGATSRAGKTAAAVSLLRARPGSAALKFTTTEAEFAGCPRHLPCLVCDIDVPYRVIEDHATLAEPGTDTARLGAVAVKVLWVISRRDALASAWAAAQERLADQARVVIEGSSVLEVARPHGHVFVAHPFLSPERWKENARRLASAADVVVVNRAARELRGPDARVLEALAAAAGRRGVRVADVTGPAEQWAEAVLPRVAVAS